MISRRRLSVQQTHHLPLHEGVLLDYFDVTGQPTGHAGTLLNRFCRSVGADFTLFPIDLLNWKKVPEHKRNHTWFNIVKVTINYSILVI